MRVSGCTISLCILRLLSFLHNFPQAGHLLSLESGTRFHHPYLIAYAALVFSRRALSVVRKVYSLAVKRMLFLCFYSDDYSFIHFVAHYRANLVLRYSLVFCSIF
jgi:hypothetical protein